MAEEAGIQKPHLSPARDLDSDSKVSEFAWDDSRRALGPDIFFLPEALKSPTALKHRLLFCCGWSQLIHVTLYIIYGGADSSFRSVDLGILSSHVFV